MAKEILIFESARSVIKAEKLCRKNSIFVTVVPLPEEYSSECGMGLVIDDVSSKIVRELLDSQNIQAKNYTYEK